MQVKESDVDDLFLLEMADVKPLSQDKIATDRTHISSKSAQAQMARRLAAQYDAGCEHLPLENVALLQPDDFVEFKRDGLQLGVYRKLRLGQYPLQARLDLHGKTLKQARQALLHFIASCTSQEIRSVIVVHGKGLTSSPQALLKSYVSYWLTQLPDVLAFHCALRRHGGSGALYLLLRKNEASKLDNWERHAKRMR